MTKLTRPRRPDETDVELGLGDLFELLVARKWTVLSIALVVMVASVFSAARQPTTYASRASVVVTGAAQTSLEAQQLLATGKRLARSRSVAVIVAQNLHRTDTPEHLLEGLSVSIPLNTQLIEFKYSAATPREAALLAQAFVDAYRQYQADVLDTLVASSRAIDQLADSLRSRLLAAQTTAATAKTPSAVSDAKTEIESLEDQIRRVDQKRAMLLTSAPMLSTLAEAASPGVQNAPPLKRATVVGLVAGGVLGAFAAFGSESLRARRRRKRAAVLVPTANERSGPRRGDVQAALEEERLSTFR